MPNSIPTPAQVVFYVVAHPDDWIYFTPSIFYDVQSVGKDTKNPSKLVIVYVTSGDAGRTDGWWQAREEGAKAATRFPASISSMRNSLPDAFDSTEWQSEDGSEYRFGVTKSYFLRIPDTQVQNLLDETPQTTVDALKTHSGQEDLYRKLESIIEGARNGCTTFQINTLSDREHKPTQENCDHIGVGKAIRAVVDRLRTKYDCEGVFWHAYSNADKTTNPVVPRYTDYPVNADSHVYFDLLVWKAMALGAYSAKIQETFPNENGVHLYWNAESVQWLSHMCIDYTYPANRKIDDLYRGVAYQEGI